MTMKNLKYILLLFVCSLSAQHETMLMLSQEQYANEGGGGSNLPTETILEAEDDFTATLLSDSHNWKEGSGQSGYNGTGYLWMQGGTNCATFSATCGSRADWVFDIPTTGDYYVHVRFYAGNADKDSFHLGWDENYDTTYNGLTPHNAWTWYATSAINLTAGVHTLNMWNREIGILIDQIKVSTSATTP